MKSGFKILDSEMHLREPADLWDRYRDREWRDRAPKILSSTARSSAMVLIDGKILQGYKPSYRGGIFDATRIDEEIADYRTRGFDASACRSNCPGGVVDSCRHCDRKFMPMQDNHHTAKRETPIGRRLPATFYLINLLVWFVGGAVTGAVELLWLVVLPLLPLIVYLARTRRREA